MPDSVVLSGRVDNKAQSFHLKHTLTAGISDHGYTHIPNLCSQYLILYGTLHMRLIPKRIPHDVRMAGTSHSQDPDPVNCAGMRESVRYHAWSATVELLLRLSIVTLTFISDIVFGVLLYLVFQLAVITGHCAVVYTQKFGPGASHLMKICPR